MSALCTVESRPNAFLGDIGCGLSTPLADGRGTLVDRRFSRCFSRYLSRGVWQKAAFSGMTEFPGNSSRQEESGFRYDGVYPIQLRSPRVVSHEITRFRLTRFPDRPVSPTRTGAIKRIAVQRFASPAGRCPIPSTSSIGTDDDRCIRAGQAHRLKPSPGWGGPTGRGTGAQAGDWLHRRR